MIQKIIRLAVRACDHQSPQIYWENANFPGRFSLLTGDSTGLDGWRLVPPTPEVLAAAKVQVRARKVCRLYPQRPSKEGEQLAGLIDPKLARSEMGLPGLVENFLRQSEQDQEVLLEILRERLSEHLA